MSNKVLITGGPGTGKTSVAKELKSGLFLFSRNCKRFKIIKAKSRYK